MLLTPKSERKSAADFAPIERPGIGADVLKILLIKPDVGEVSVGFTSLARVPPLDLLMVAASAEGHEIQILDLRLEEDEVLLSQLNDFDPHVVGVTAYSAEAESTKDICRQIRQARPDMPIVQGGYHAAMAPEDAMDESAVDFLVMGEAETILAPLLKALQATASTALVRAGVAPLTHWTSPRTAASGSSFGRVAERWVPPSIVLIVFANE